jgi:Methyltransferase domain
VHQHWFCQWPTLQNIFMTNVITQGLGDYVLPLPLDSLNAVQVPRHDGIQLDLLHLDEAHDYDSIRNDLHAWWPLINPGGTLIGDDYYRNGTWPGVRQAFDEFFSAPALPRCNSGTPSAGCASLPDAVPAREFASWIKPGLLPGATRPV